MFSKILLPTDETTAGHPRRRRPSNLDHCSDNLRVLESCGGAVRAEEGS